MSSSMEYKLMTLGMLKEMGLEWERRIEGGRVRGLRLASRSVGLFMGLM